MAFYDGSQLISRAKSGVKMVEADGTTTQLPGANVPGSSLDRQVAQHLSEKNQEKWAVAQVLCLCPNVFLDAPSHLYKRVCPSVCPSVRPSVRGSVSIKEKRGLGASYVGYPALFL